MSSKSHGDIITIESSHTLSMSLKTLRPFIGDYTDDGRNVVRAAKRIKQQKITLYYNTYHSSNIFDRSLMT